jgi:hypothetical protein
LTTNTVTLTLLSAHGLNLGDLVTLSGFVTLAGNINSTLTVSGTPTANTVVLSAPSTSATTVTTIGTAIFSNGANVGAHLICQEAMS